MIPTRNSRAIFALVAVTAGLSFNAVAQAVNFGPVYYTKDDKKLGKSKGNWTINGDLSDSRLQSRDLKGSDSVKVYPKVKQLAYGSKADVDCQVGVPAGVACTGDEDNKWYEVKKVRFANVSTRQRADRLATAIPETADKARASHWMCEDVSYRPDKCGTGSTKTSDR